MQQIPSLLQTKDANAISPYKNKKEPSYGRKIKGLTPFTGSWDKSTAKHLLNRTLFGFTKQQLNTAVSDGLNNSLAKLLAAAVSPAPPLNNYGNVITDPFCNFGDSWVDKELTDPNLIGYRNASMQDWWLGLMIKQNTSIQEKLTIFWHNHFATEFDIVIFPNLNYTFIELLRMEGLGNFKTLVKDVTLHPAMLRYLNGEKNVKGAPDENYSRELQELFTLGKGPDSQYTEEDVKEAAKLLTGYSINYTDFSVVWTPNNHDQEDKHFSSFYNNQVISGSATKNQELDQLIDMIFTKDEVAKHMCRKLYRFFVYYVIDAEVEQKIIEPLAQTFIANNYEIKPVLEQLLASEHFFEDHVRGAVIKNPLDLVAGFYKTMNVSLAPESEIENYYNGLRFTNFFNIILSMLPGDPPNVAGWPAYWNSPSYHEFWINSVSIQKRNQLTDGLIWTAGISYMGAKLVSDIIAYTEGLEDSYNPNKLIEEVLELHIPKQLDLNQIEGLKSILLSGLGEDYYWTQAWDLYQNDKANTTYYQTVLFRLYSFYKAVFNLAEYQLI